MLPRERVFKTLAHQEPDIIPWGELWIDYNIYEDILGRETLVHAKMKETKAWWEGRDKEIIEFYKRDVIDLVEALGLDIVTTELLAIPEYMQGSRGEDGFRRPMKQTDENVYQDDDGSIWHVSTTTHELMPYWLNPDSYTPPTLESIEKKIDEIDRNGVKKPDDWKWEMVRHVVKKMKGTHFIVGVPGEDVAFPSFGQTTEEVYLNLALHPEMHAKIAELAGKRAIGMLKYYAEEGIDGLIPGADFGSSTGLSANPKIFIEHVFPWLKAYCDEVHRLGMKAIKHSCGRTLEIFDYFIKAGYDAYQSIQPTAGMDIKLLKERYGDRITLWGGVSNENLIGGKVKDVEADAHYAIKYVAPKGGFIYGASHSLAVGTSLENILAMKEYREKFGSYPIQL